MMSKSVSGRIWHQEEVDESLVSNIVTNFGLSDLTARILASRVADVKEAQHFLYPKIKNLLPDPFHLLDMRQGVLRALEAIEKNQKICIFADYDVDGATSSALLKNVFRDLGVEACIYVPDRLIEGYGPTKEGMEKIKCAGAELVITVDCGTVAHEALKHAKEIGLDVIVIDHHISSETLPEAVAVINPNRLDETSSCRQLAAVGVAFLFAVGLIIELKGRKNFNLPAPDLLQYLDIVALGTVCDVMPITGLNRAIVSQGLKMMAQRRNRGIRALCDIAGIDERPSCYHLGFILGPRINAGGRVGRSDLGAKLLSETDEARIAQIADELNTHNNERRVIELVMLEEADKIAKEQKDNPMLFVAKEGWHPGVIGIAASRLKDKYNKPTAVIALNGGIGKASCRSVKGVDFGNKVIQAKDRGILVAGGGHSMAAGFTVEEDKLQELHKFLSELFAPDMLLAGQNREKYSAELTTHSLNIDLLKDLEILAPYGSANPEPLFRISGLFVLKADIVGESHIRCLLAPSKNTGYGNKAISAIAFNAISTELEKVILSPRSLVLSVIGTVRVNNWQDRQIMQVQIKDLIVEE